MPRLHRIVLLLLAASSFTFAQAPSSRSPDEVLIDRAMSGICEGKFDVAILSLRTLLNTYPDSLFSAEAVELLKDPRLARCDGSQSGTPACSGSKRTAERHTAWIEEVLHSAESVTAGMTRADLLKVFTTEGGLSSLSSRTYVYRECPYIKVDVKFSISEHAEHQNDIIVSISRPYLAWSIAD